MFEWGNGSGGLFGNKIVITHLEKKNILQNVEVFYV